MRAGELPALANYDFAPQDDSRISGEQEVRKEGGHKGGSMGAGGCFLPPLPPANPPLHPSLSSPPCQIVLTTLFEALNAPLPAATLLPPLTPSLLCPPSPPPCQIVLTTLFEALNADEDGNLPADMGPESLFEDRGSLMQARWSLPARAKA